MKHTWLFTRTITQCSCFHNIKYESSLMCTRRACDANKHGKPPEWRSACHQQTEQLLLWDEQKQSVCHCSFPHSSLTLSGRTKPERFNLFSESEAFVTHLVLLSWASIQLCHPAIRVSPVMHSALLWLPVNRPWISATHSSTWPFAVINMLCGSL